MKLTISKDLKEILPSLMILLKSASQAALVWDGSFPNFLYPSLVCLIRLIFTTLSKE